MSNLKFKPIMPSDLPAGLEMNRLAKIKLVRKFKRMEGHAECYDPADTREALNKSHMAHGGLVQYFPRSAGNPDACSALNVSMALDKTQYGDTHEQGV
jgi:hypothetical protein